MHLLLLICIHLAHEAFADGKDGADLQPDAIQYGKGLLIPDNMEEDEKSRKFFDRYRLAADRQSVPSSYSSVDYGYDSPVKNQGSCGSCTAFSTMATMEVCFKKLTGITTDLSEQQIVDCAYGSKGAYGCNGAFIEAYFEWASNRSLDPALETQYPYKADKTNYKCPSPMPQAGIGAVFGEVFNTYRADEELMKQLVYKHGAVVSTVKAEAAFQAYKSGVFSGCSSTSNQDHAITVVGYGTENGEPYWLVKNSWGPYWGDKGYIKMKRGVHMCGIGKHVAVAECKRSNGPTQPTPPPSSDCEDFYSNCLEYVKYCYDMDSMKTGCKKTCNFCSAPTLRPITTTTTTSAPCDDFYGNCADYIDHCNTWDLMVTGCKATCNRC